MSLSQTIAMARGVLAEGRAGDAARMIEPLVQPLEGDDLARSEAQSQIVLRCLLARIRLLRDGDSAGALALLVPFGASRTREVLAPQVRAEVALWLGWAHAWPLQATYDDARALNLLGEADRFFRAEINAAGRCWTCTGQAQAYSTIDEYPLMLRALEEASALQEKIVDAQAEAWIHDLGAAGCRLNGRYPQAQQHVTALANLAAARNDAALAGRAAAHQTALFYELGRPAALIAEQADAAEAALDGTAWGAAPLLQSRLAHIRALIRQGAWQEADSLINDALGDAAQLPGGGACLLVERARLAMLRGRFAEADALLDDVLARLPRPNRLLGAVAALLRCELHARQGRIDRSLEWADRAHRSARESGHGGYQLAALLELARIHAHNNDLLASRRYMAEAEEFGTYFSLLPFAGLRFAILGRLALASDRPDDARAYFMQALSAYSLISDMYQTAGIRVELARLELKSDPVQARTLLDAAARSYQALNAAAEVETVRKLLRSIPGGGAHSPQPGDFPTGSALARASVSIELVAEVWLQAVERLLPGRWMALYRQNPDGTDVIVHEHGQRPAHVDDSSHKQILRSAPGPSFYAIVERLEGDDPLYHQAFERLKPWVPVAGLALDHALLRASRLDIASGAESPDHLSSLPLKGFVHASPAMQTVARQVQRICGSHSPVLITGESGTGKELVAGAVHATSERKDAAFIAFNCSTVPRELVDSHLFGHERGSFTGATRAHLGVIRAADGGTLFLDEIGDLPLDVQPKLLRFLQEGEVFPLGARRPVHVNVRVVAATNHDLEVLIRAGGFREDLYYRLNVIPVRVPPLRDRREEIPLLVRHFLSTLRPEGTPLASITNRALEALLRYPWPGNVRQLRNEIERALVYVSTEPAPLIDLKDLSPAIIDGATLPASHPAEEQILRPEYGLGDVLAGTERKLIERVLAEQGGRITASAQVLGLTRQGLYKKLKRLDIDAGRFQREPNGHLMLGAGATN